ncbi:MAG: hypothetical protein KAI40_04365 [Desulfobacterales bacterium]|nr:hypothetical protein [Desulfobacterales bacterium]
MENRNDKTAFFGKVTASVTHEMQNVLAIIKENSGLMEDFLLINQTGDLSDIEEKLGKCIKTIKKQAYRGVDLTSGLNGFVHTTDNARMSVNILDLVKKLISITERIFRQKNVNISIIESEKPYSVIIDPLFFQMVSFLCIECLVESFEADGAAAIDIRLSNNQAAIEFLYADSILKYEDYKEKIIHNAQWLKITDLCRQANFKAEISPGGFGILIIFE